MALVRHEPWTAIDRLHRELEDLPRAPLAPDANRVTRRPVALLITHVDANAEAIYARSHHSVLALTIQKLARPEPRRISVEAP